jgi:gamma-glutamyltranspeptidase/glutathione hydrolase
MSRLLTVCFLYSLCHMPTTGNAMDRTTGATFASRSEVIAKHGMAATSHPLATQIAVDILKQGGNAIDAAATSSPLSGLQRRKNSMDSMPAVVHRKA